MADFGNIKLDDKYIESNILKKFITKFTNIEDIENIYNKKIYTTEDLKCFNKKGLQDLCNKKNIKIKENTKEITNKELINRLTNFDSKNIKIHINDIENFIKKSTKDKNGEINDMREDIILNIINKNIPLKYYKKNSKWEDLRKALNEWIIRIKEKEFPRMKDEVIKFEKKGGRKNSYDFIMKVSGKSGRNNSEKEYKIEFKYNTNSIEGAPQFSSPSNPDKYFIGEKYVKYYYDNYLDKIVKKANEVLEKDNKDLLGKPDRDVYIETINNNNPLCMVKYKELGEQNKEFSTYCNEQSKKSINEFMKKCELNTGSLSEYLCESQKDKHYMLYHNGTFIYDKNKNNDIYKIKRGGVIIKAPNFICETVSNNKLEVMLRWKNGNGIAYPAFQISRKIPIKKDLIKLLKNNNIEFSTKSLVADLRSLLDKNGIIY
jgi:hypothetical protein